MTTRTAQALLTGILLVPLMIVALSGPPWASVSQAQSPAGGMLGPLAPARVDTSGDGQPSGNDTGIVPTRNGNQLTLMTPWNCNPGDPDNVVNMSNPNEATGRFQTFTRSIDGFRLQAVTTGGLVNGRPMSLNFTEMSQLSPATTASGVLAGQDFNGDGAVDGINASGNHSGISMNVSTNLAFADPTRDGNADFVSIPWSQASAFGVEFGDACGGSDPQIWVPLADTNGDGRPDSIVFDLDGNGIADPDLYSSPLLVVAAVPTMGRGWLVALTALLGATAIWSLRRRDTMAGLQ